MKEQDGSSRSWEKSINPEHGINYESERSLRLIPVFDAIGSACVFKKGHHVMAVGLQFNAEQQEVWLIIAENQ